MMLLYVNMNINIVSLGYKINDRQKTLSYFLDQHRLLLYNLNKLESPTMLSEKLSNEDIELVETDMSNVYYADAIGEDYISRKAVPTGGVVERFLDIFTLKAEAIQGN